ncbi:hypothetical protein ABVT39_012303 [Epinephelus coioides]
MVERGLAGPHTSAECSQSSFPAGHVDSMMASRGVLCSYEILNLLGPQVWTDHLQASVACGEPGDQMSLSNAHAQTHTHSAKAVNNHEDKENKRDLKKEEKKLGAFRVQKETQAFSEKQPKGQRVLVDCRPLQGLVHLHVVQSVLSLPSVPPRHLCLPRCAAVYVEQR